MEGVFGQPCLKYGTANVARSDLLITTETQESDWQNNPTYIRKDDLGRWFWGFGGAVYYLR